MNEETTMEIYVFKLVFIAYFLIPLPLGYASEHCIVPNTLPKTSCPVKTCLTIDQYFNNSGDDFASNSVLYFLPGNYMFQRPVVFRDTYNLSLKSLDDGEIHVYTGSQFSCQCQSCL